MFLVIGVGREIDCVATTASTNILYVRVRVTSTIKLNIEENFKIWMLSFLGRSKYYLTQNDYFFDKEKIYFEAEAVNVDGNT